MVVIGLGKNLLLKSVLGHCADLYRKLKSSKTEQQNSSYNRKLRVRWRENSTKTLCGPFTGHSIIDCRAVGTYELGTYIVFLHFVLT